MDGAPALVDTHFMLFTSIFFQTPNKRLTITAAHHGGINDLTWLDQNTIASAGQDSTARTWNVSWDN